jgi:N-acetyl-gamma-glutamyl-phosphate reductase
MIVSIPLQLWALPGSPKPRQIHEVLAEHYTSNPASTVAVPPLEKSWAAKDWLDAESLNGTDNLTIHVFGHEELGQAVICAVLDNLGKGAAGQAVQNLELMLGLSSED